LRARRFLEIVHHISAEAGRHNKSTEFPLQITKIGFVFTFGIKQKPKRIIPKGIVTFKRQMYTQKLKNITFPIIVNFGRIVFEPNALPFLDQFPQEINEKKRLANTGVSVMITLLKPGLIPDAIVR
jgi:hypothetical protein